MNTPQKTCPAPALFSAVILLACCLAGGCASPRAYHKVKPALPPPSAGQGRAFVCLQKGNLPYQVAILIDGQFENHAQPGEFLYVDLPFGEHEVNFVKGAAPIPECRQKFRLEEGQPVVIELLCSGGEEVVEMPASALGFSSQRPLVAPTAYSVATTPLRWSSQLVAPEKAEKVLAKYTLEPGAWDRLESAKFSSLPEETTENSTGSK